MKFPFRRLAKTVKPVADIPETHSATDETNFEDLAMEAGHFRSELQQGSHLQQRKRLRDIQQLVTHKSSIGGHDATITVRLLDDGQPGEIKIKLANQDSTISRLIDTIATLISLALQYGVSLDTVVHEIQHKRIPISGSPTASEFPTDLPLLDYVLSWLEQAFSAGDLGKHISPPSSDAP